MMKVETEPISHVKMRLEQSEPEPELESSLIPSIPPASSSIDLVMVSESAHQEITVAFV